MKSDLEVRQSLDQAIAKLSGTKNCPCDVLDIRAMTPDASLRRYFRIQFSSDIRPGKQTAVAMYFDSVQSPEAGGEKQVSTDLAVLELSDLFRRNGVSVPEIYLDAREYSVILLEDLGDRQLASELLEETNSSISNDSEIQKHLRQAIEEIGKIQGIAQDSQCFAFRRSFSEAVFFNEMMEFRDYVAAGLLVPNDIKLLEDECAKLAKHVIILPQALSHRDFHAWNLMIDFSGQVRVIDFQDALMAPRVYDLVSFLHDRDMDAAIGENRYRALLTQFREAICHTPESRSDEFHREVDAVALQRDLKVAGRFRKLSKVRGLVQYDRWVPGTLHRIGRTLSRMCGRELNSGLGALLESLSDAIPEIAEGRRQQNRYTPNVNNSHD